MVEQALRTEQPPPDDASPDLFGDAVGRSLHQARELIDTVMRERGRLAHAGEVVELPPDRMTAAAHRRRIVSGACGIVLYAPTPGPGGPDAVAELADAARAGVVVRVLCGAAGSAELVAAALAAGAATRVCDVALPELLIVDRRVVLLRLAGAQMLLVHAPVLVATLAGLGEQAWRAGSVPAPRERNGAARERNGAAGRGGALAAAILGAMMAGHKDAAAARQLGLSVRQYRRHVAEIMHDLGASSRFQAGARAVELGLVPGVRCRPGGPGEPGDPAHQPMIPPSTPKTPPVT